MTAAVVEYPEPEPGPHEFHEGGRLVRVYVRANRVEAQVYAAGDRGGAGEPVLTHSMQYAMRFHLDTVARAAVERLEEK